MTDFAKAAAALQKAIGKNDDEATVPCWLSTGYMELDHAISGRYDGGLPGGRIIEIYGPESSGKTWLATNAMISAQRMGGFAGFEDHERSFMSKVGVGLGLSTTPGQWSYKQPESFERSAVNFINGVTAIRESGAFPPEAPGVWVFDSLAGMIPQQMLAKDATALNMNDTTALARLTSKVFPAIAQIAQKHNVMAIFLNQLRVKPGVVYGDPNTTPGGNAPKYWTSVRIQLGATRLTKEEGTGDNKVVSMLGQQVTARCIKNKVSRPFVTAKWKFLFGDDGIGRFAVAESLIDFAVKKGLLTTSGSFVEWEGGKFYKGPLAKKIEAEGKLPALMDLIKRSGAAPDLEMPDELPIEAEAA